MERKPGRGGKSSKTHSFLGSANDLIALGKVKSKNKHGHGGSSSSSAQSSPSDARKTGGGGGSSSSVIKSTSSLTSASTSVIKSTSSLTSTATGASPGGSSASVIEKQEISSPATSKEVKKAEQFLDILRRKDDVHTNLRTLFRDTIKASKFDFNIHSFISHLLKETDDIWKESAEANERLFLNCTDLILLSMFLSVSPAVRESSVVRGNVKDIGILTEFQLNISKIQKEGVSWLYTLSPNLYRPGRKEYLISLNKILLKDPANEIQTKDNWPTEYEKSLFGRLCHEVPLDQDTLIWILLMGVSKEHHVTPTESIDLAEHLLCRSAIHKKILPLSKLEIVELLFRLCEYNPPDNIVLPAGYTSPKLAIAKLYWRVAMLLTIAAAYNPDIFGKLGWQNYPSVKIFMEMCMTRHFLYPTQTCENYEELHAKELQIIGLEKEEILEFETHLAAASSKATINEKSSLLLPQVMRLDPMGATRTPPQPVLIQLELFNQQMNLGMNLCKSRNPDFLLEIIQGNSQPMPWLSELISEGSFEILPVQSLCEFMLGQSDRISKGYESTIESHDKSSKKQQKGAPDIAKDDNKTIQLVQYLQKILQNENDDSIKEILHYFLRRLSSPKLQSRVQALKGLQILLTDNKTLTEENWLLDTLPSIRTFSENQKMICSCLRSAIQVENEPEWLNRYLEFLNLWGNFESGNESTETEMDNLAMDVAQLVVERNHVMSILLTDKYRAFDSLFGIFLNYMKNIRESHKDAFKWSENIDQVAIEWKNEHLAATMNILVLHAIVILVSSYSTIISSSASASSSSSKGPERKKLKTGKSKSTTELKYNELLDMWFPIDQRDCPKGFLLNTSEEADLYPDWLKIKMIRSNNSRLVSASLSDLKTDQLVLFIQSFGIPIQSMTALLYCLQTIFDKDPQKVLNVIDNVGPSYMISIIEVQWKRGVCGSEGLVEHLKKIVAAQNNDSEKMDIDGPKKFCVRPKMSMSSSTTMQPMNLTPIKTSSSSSTTIKKQSGKRPAPMEVDPPANQGNIRSLSRELLNISANRRRSSVPIPHVGQGQNGDMSEDSMRRHSSHLEGGFRANILVENNNLGQLVDSITNIEPCIVRNALDVQLPLLFGRHESAPVCRSFLLTVLIHQSGWQTVQQCMKLFLNEFDSSYDPSAILELISATHKNPKLWQGCDKYTPRHQEVHSVFKLSIPELLVMAEYIIEEISQLEMKNTKFSITNLLGPVQNSSQPKDVRNSKQCLQSRVTLWLTCTAQDKQVVDQVVNTLLCKKPKNPCVKRFISQVYLEFPVVIMADCWLERSRETVSLPIDDEMSSILDSITHTLITAIANVQPGKEWTKKNCRDMDICLRKITFVHPKLVLRQLALMGALLEGRTHLDFSVFHNQNHNVPFKIFMGLMDIMQPDIYKQMKTLSTIFPLYFKFFTSYGHMKDYSLMLSRMLSIITNVLLLNTSEMREFIAPHYDTLRELSELKYYSEMSLLSNLLSAIDPNSPKIASTSLIPISLASTSVSGPPGHSSNFQKDKDLASSILDRLSYASNNEETLTILAELDALSLKNPAILNNFQQTLNMLLVSTNDSCKTESFNLALRHGIYNPGAGNLYFETIMQTLEKGNSTVKDTILERIHQFIMISQEKADIILNRLFDLGLHSNLNCLPAIHRSLSLLRGQSGCGF